MEIWDKLKILRFINFSRNCSKCPKVLSFRFLRKIKDEYKFRKVLPHLPSLPTRVSGGGHVRAKKFQNVSERNWLNAIDAVDGSDAVSMQQLNQLMMALASSMHRNPVLTSSIPVTKSVLPNKLVALSNICMDILYTFT